MLLNCQFHQQYRIIKNVFSEYEHKELEQALRIDLHTQYFILFEKYVYASYPASLDCVLLREYVSCFLKSSMMNDIDPSRCLHSSSLQTYRELYHHILVFYDYRM